MSRFPLCPLVGGLPDRQVSLEVVDEEDVPTLVRTTLASLMPQDDWDGAVEQRAALVAVVRREVARISLPNQLVALEVIIAGAGTCY